jgi:hypothetical protein
LKAPRDVLITALICPQLNLSAADRGRGPPFPSLRAFLCPGVRQGLGRYVLTIEPAHVWLAKPAQSAVRIGELHLGNGTTATRKPTAELRISRFPPLRQADRIFTAADLQFPPRTPGPAARRSFGIRAARRIWQVPITAPFCDLPVHVVNTHKDWALWLRPLEHFFHSPS